MKRFLVALLAGGAVFGAVLGSAAALGVNGGSIQAGVDSDLRCDTDGVNVAGWGYEEDDHSVYFVRFDTASIDCTSGEMFVAVLDSAGNALTYGGPEDLATTDGKVSFDAPVAPEAISKLRVTIGAPS